MDAQLLSTKTEIPPTRNTLVARHTLLERLDEGLVAGQRLFLVSAPAGYGKTTLLSHWIAHLRAGDAQLAPPAETIHCAWLALDAGDNDPTRFLNYLGAAVRQIDAAFPLRLFTAAGQGELAAWNGVLPLVVNEIATLAGAVLLVLDDYHHIAAQPIHDAVAALLEFMPTNLHLVISTRADPPLPLARLRGCGQLHEVRQNDLRFSATEATEFLTGAMGIALAAEQVTTLLSRTEGWIAGLQMAALSLRERGDVAEFIHAFAGSHRHVLDYLSEEVYNRQPADIRRFLLQTSILDRFNAPLCAALMAPLSVQPAQTSAPETLNSAAAEVNKAQHILDHLDHANLFVARLDDERRWYRYHHLFADLLRLRLEQEQPDAAALLHLRASRWYEDQQLIHEAVRHALAAHCYDRAAGLIEAAAEGAMLKSEVYTLQLWLEALPLATLQTHPMLCIYKAGALLLADATAEQVEPWLQTAARSGDAHALAGFIAVCRAFMAAAYGQTELSTQLARAALAQLPEQSAFFQSFAQLILALNALEGEDDAAAVQYLRAVQVTSDRMGNILTSVLTRCHLAELAMLRNHLDEAEELYRDALAVAGEAGGLGTARGFPLIGLGLIAYERNQLDDAQRLLEKCTELICGWGKMGAVQAAVVLAKVHRARHDPVGAAAIFHKAEEWVAHTAAMGERMGRYILLSQVNITLWMDDLATAERHAAAAGIRLDHTDSTPTPPVTVKQCYAQLVRAHLLAARGRYSDALRDLEVLEHCAARQGRERLALLAQLEGALAHQALGNLERAIDLLCTALTLAAPAGCIRVFVDAGPAMAELLRMAQRRTVHPDFAACALAAFTDAAVATPVTTPQSGAPALSPRELQVLALAEQGLTNQEIAVRLTVALCTVKTHINNICRKLDATNRTAAVARARRLHLLDIP